MRIKMLIAAAAITVTGAFATGAAAADKAPSTVTIKSLGGGEFTGKVKSADADCVAERTVILYKLTGSSPQPRADQKIVTDTTDETGRWNTGQTGERSGKFYAKVKRTPLCKGDLSPVVRALP